MTHLEMNNLHMVPIDIWLKLCMEYLLTNFLEAGAQYFTEWKLFPPVYREVTLSVTKKIAMLLS